MQRDEEARAVLRQPKMQESLTQPHQKQGSFIGPMDLYSVIRAHERVRVHLSVRGGRHEVEMARRADGLAKSPLDQGSIIPCPTSTECRIVLDLHPLRLVVARLLWVRKDVEAVEVTRGGRL